MDLILTLPEVAVLLEVAERAVYPVTRSCQIPNFRVCGQLRLKHDDIDVGSGEQKASVKDNLRKGAGDV